MRKRHLLKTAKLTLVALSVSAIATQASAKTAEWLFRSTATTEQAQQVVEKYDKDSVEVIEVRGKRPFTFYAKDRSKKLNAVFEHFNAAIADRDLHIECPRGAYSRGVGFRQKCSPAFEKRLRQEELGYRLDTTNINGGNIALSTSSSAGGQYYDYQELEQRRDDLKTEIISLLESDEQFRSAFVAYHRAETAYKKAHAKKFGKLSGYHKTHDEGVDNS